MTLRRVCIIWLSAFFGNQHGDFSSLRVVHRSRKNALEMLNVQPSELSRRHQGLRNAGL